MERRFGSFNNYTYFSDEKRRLQSVNTDDLILNTRDLPKHSRHDITTSRSSSSNIGEIHYFSSNSHAQVAKEFEFKSYLSEQKKKLLINATKEPDFEIRFALYCENMVRINLRVDPGLVGLVVGPKGETIKRIQKDTGTFILTPSKNKDPLFMIYGQPEDVETAKELIIIHIKLRTQNWMEENDDENQISCKPLDDIVLPELTNFNLATDKRWSQAWSNYSFINSVDLIGQLDAVQFISNSSQSTYSNSGLRYSDYETKKVESSVFQHKYENKNSVFEKIPEENIDMIQDDKCLDNCYEENDEDFGDSDTSLPTNEEIDALLTSMRSNASIKKCKGNNKAAGTGRSILQCKLDFCLLCFSTDIQFTFLPCGHSPFCYSCAHTFLHKNCLICCDLVESLSTINMQNYERTFY